MTPPDLETPTTARPPICPTEGLRSEGRGSVDDPAVHDRQEDLRPERSHGPVFERIRKDPAFFRSVRVDEELGTIVRPNGADIDPDV